MLYYLRGLRLMSALLDLIEKYSPHAIFIREQIHQNPELSNQEYKTSQLIERELESYGIRVDNLGMETGVTGLIIGGKSGKTIAIRADIDALPIVEETGLPYASKVEGVSHACGHDIHTSILLLIARIAQELREDLEGNIRLIFQPAEEKGTGAKEQIDSGIMELEPKVDLVLGVHCSPELDSGTIGLIKGPASASADAVKITVRGVGGHGAHPYRAVDPIVVSAYLITQLQTIVSRENPAVKPAVLTFGSIHGGSAMNIIPREVTLEGTLRTFYEDSRKNMQEAIERISKCTSEAMRASVELEISNGIPVLNNTPEVIDDIYKAALETIGEDKVFWSEHPSPGSDDFAYFVESIPGALFRIGTGNDDKNTRLGLHNSENIFDSDSIIWASMVILQYLFNTKKTK